MYCNSRLGADFGSETFSFSFKTDTKDICKTTRQFFIRELFWKLVIFVEKHVNRQCVYYCCV